MSSKSTTLVSNAPTVHVSEDSSEASTLNVDLSEEKEKLEQSLHLTSEHNQGSVTAEQNPSNPTPERNEDNSLLDQPQGNLTPELDSELSSSPKMFMEVESGTGSADDSKEDKRVSFNCRKLLYYLCMVTRDIDLCSLYFLISDNKGIGHARMSSKLMCWAC